ncbi:hypothetical protein PGIGA_G00112490 [Pangasianodon gigas]|uniref:Uncharacterized protein n=1 Tax=Pangasianodon gigas TaxID=30993 RepID=A0ACC5WAC8_PANGG|nr:hypothetical protein [Pangasianodon gigas]
MHFFCDVDVLFELDDVFILACREIRRVARPLSLLFVGQKLQFLHLSSSVVRSLLCLSQTCDSAGLRHDQICGIPEIDPSNDQEFR